MKNFTAQDLEALARGPAVPPEVFQEICANPQAFEEWTRLLRARDLLQPPDERPEPGDVPTTMDVSLEELTCYREGGPLQAERRAAVERFLRAHFPEALPPEREMATEIDLDSSGHTEVDLPPEGN